MSHVHSPSTGPRDGVALLCRVLEIPRATVYAQRGQRARTEPPAKRGPKPAVADATLATAIRADLAATDFHGEGHRKVWARLRRAGVCVARRRMMRVMR
jgi:hypothetical protein